MSIAPCAGLLHTDFMHLAGSLLPWAVLACLLELNYGSVRVVMLWLVSLLGGAFASAVLDPPCQVVRVTHLLPFLPWQINRADARLHACTTELAETATQVVCLRYAQLMHVYAVMPVHVHMATCYERPAVGAIQLKHHSTSSLHCFSCV